MRKITLFALALVAMVASANAQRMYYTPWDGNYSYALNVGTDFSIVQRNFGTNSFDIASKPGIAASFRYEGDKDITDNLLWGYQVELEYLMQKIMFNKTLETTNIQHNDCNWWDLQIDFRFSFAYRPIDNLELQVAAGIFVSPLFGMKGTTYETTAAGVEVPDSREDTKVPVFFNLGSGVSTMLQAKYFFSDQGFVSLNIHDNIGIDLFGKDFSDGLTLAKGGQRGVVMLGIGYKFER